jgi:hypothetical protein
MKKAVLVLDGVSDKELREAMTNEAVLTLLTFIAVKFQMPTFIGAGQSVPADLYHRMKEPVFSNN